MYPEDRNVAETHQSKHCSEFFYYYYYFLCTCLAQINRRERRFFEICIPRMRLRNNGPDVSPTSVLQNLNQGDGRKGRTDAITS